MDNFVNLAKSRASRRRPPFSLLQLLVVAGLLALLASGVFGQCAAFGVKPDREVIEAAVLTYGQEAGWATVEKIAVASLVDDELDGRVRVTARVVEEVASEPVTDEPVSKSEVKTYIILDCGYGRLVNFQRITGCQAAAVVSP